MTTKLLLTVEEAADRLGVGRTLMYALIRSGDVPSVQIGRLRRTEDAALSITAQRAAISAEGERRGWEIVWTEPDDGWSGRNVRRPGLEAALATLARREAAGIVVSKLSRLSRSLKDFGDLLETARKQKWSVVALDFGIDTTTANGRMMANVLMSVLQWEREVIGERTAEALAALPKAKRDRLGRQQAIPASTARRIRRYARDGLSTRAIASRLISSGVPAPGGGDRWHHSTVARFLARPARGKITPAAREAA